jgi:hypothetical protein
LLYLLLRLNTKKVYPETGLQACIYRFLRAHQLRQPIRLQNSNYVTSHDQNKSC